MKTRTIKGIAYRTIADIIKKTVHGIEEYDVVVDIDEVSSHITIAPKEGHDLIMVNRFSEIADAFKANCYVTIENEKPVFVIF